MSGLLALLDDVAAIAKVAAASVDDIAAAAAKAGAKAAGVVIDDAAVTPKYVGGFAAARELPIIGRIALGSMKNKLIYLLPGLMALDALAPWVITPMLMLGGAYLCFEGAEKIVHVLAPHASEDIEADFDTADPAHLEQEKIAGAIKTDFILSAEIMTIALAAIPDSTLVTEAATLAIVGTLITVLVYGAVALIVKMDDIGLAIAAHARTKSARAFGRGLVTAMPRLLSVLATVGTGAMLWVGGSIVLHGLEVTHLWPAPYEVIAHWAEAAAEVLPLAGLTAWAVTALCDGILGLALGLAVIPLVNRVVEPLIDRLAAKA